MSNEELYLKQNVLMEPLVDQWYAWAQSLMFSLQQIGFKNVIELADHALA